MARDVRLIRSPISVAGMVLTTISAVLFLVVFLADLFGLHTNPYIGIIFFLLLPALFIVGLAMIPIGASIERRRRAAGKSPSSVQWPRLDLNDPRQRGIAVTVFVLTMTNVVIVSLASYRGVEYMESPQFCGQVCHTVMEPEYVAHREGPHSRVVCVECHVGSGARSFVYYKLNGMRQLAHLVSGNYPRPVPSPVFNMRPARSTCEMCHTPEKFHGDKVDIVPEYANDEKNTSNSTRLVMHVGGGLPEFGLGAGIHWHNNPQIEIDFVATDAKRQEIPYVRLKDKDGQIHEFRTPTVTDAQVANGERRQMDCIDCHNRPTHAFFATPERAVDAAIARGAIAAELPFARRQAVEALKAEYADRTAAERGIADRLRAFYGANAGATASSQKADVDQLVTTTQFLYARSVFPAMKVSWGAHADNLGHTDAPGCFRCHDDQHKTADGRVIKQDCDLCHEIQ
jgi:hypothetical protein